MKERPQPQTEMDERLLIRALINNPPASIVTAEPDQMPEDKGAIFEPEENCIYVRKGMNFSATCVRMSTGLETIRSRSYQYLLR